MRTSVCAISLCTNRTRSSNCQSRSLHFLNRNREVKVRFSVSVVALRSVLPYVMPSMRYVMPSHAVTACPPNSTRSDFRSKAFPVPYSSKCCAVLIISTFRASLPACDRPFDWVNCTVQHCHSLLRRKKPCRRRISLPGRRVPTSECSSSSTSIWAWLLAHACVVLLQQLACASLTHPSRTTVRSYLLDVALVHTTHS
jgi:hypothetical protein